MPTRERRKTMIAIKRTCAAAAVFLLALIAQAGDAGGRNDGKRWVQLKKPAMVGGVTVPPGSYMLSWVREHGSEDVRFEMARGRKIVASGRGHWIGSVYPSSVEGLVFHPEAGSSELAEIRFEGSAESIQIEAAPVRADAGHRSGAVTN
jgi:hypothetical protein